ncbi:MAG: NADH-quinone oxidoreductase subunit H [Coriobacteriales bacterium]|nr:NADH-quinone oxidoreductase subunit H [Coriobacteriales bacterium]
MDIMLILCIAFAIVFVLLAPFVGAIISGIDRKVTAKMQGRVGPKILQPIYDVLKLLGKESATVNPAQDFFVLLYLIFVVIAGIIFFSGLDFLLCVLIITLASLFLIIAAYSSRSPFAELGAQREILQVMCYEPMILIMAVGLFMANGAFNIYDLFNAQLPIIVYLPLIFIGFIFVLTIKVRKSPFDISMSHHAHQELVRGVTTEISGRSLAYIEISHWYETVLFLGWVAMFFIFCNPLVSAILCVASVIVVYFLEILIDNNFARVKWQSMLKYSWIVALLFGGVNILVLMVL